MQVKAEESCISDFGCGRIEAGQLWSEHSNDQAPALYFDADFEKAFKIDDISSVFHYDLVPDIGNSEVPFVVSSDFILLNLVSINTSMRKI